MFGYKIMPCLVDQAWKKRDLRDWRSKSQIDGVEFHDNNMTQKLTAGC